MKVGTVKVAVLPPLSITAASIVEVGGVSKKALARARFVANNIFIGSMLQFLKGGAAAVVRSETSRS